MERRGILQIGREKVGVEHVAGIVTKVYGSVTWVDGEDGQEWQCDLRAKVFRKKRQRLAVGDRVDLTPLDAPPEGEEEGPRHGVIEAVLPRRTVLRRTRDFKRDQIVCANVDRVLIVTAVLDPPYKRAFIDRVLVGVEREGLEPVVVFNKLDLCDEEYAEFVAEDAAVYSDLGYEVHLVSAEVGAGVDGLREALAGRVSAVVGPSGVGKSRLLNRVVPGLTLKTGEVSEADGRGKHTTTTAELVRVPGGGWVVDTPGVRAFGLWDLEPQEVLSGFREVEEVAVGCKFRDCRHGEEPACAVRAAVEAGEIDEERFASFLKLFEEVTAAASERQFSRRR